MKYYTDCSIPVLSFYSFIYKQDYSSLLINPKRLFKLTKKEKEILDEAFQSIFYEYCYLSDDTSLFQAFKNEIIIETLKFYVTFGVRVLEIYNKTGDSQVLKLLEEIEIKFDLDADRDKEIENAIRKLKRIKNKINIVSAKSKKTVESENDSYAKLEADALALELALKLQYPIDTSVCKMSKWVSMIQRNKINNNG